MKRAAASCSKVISLCALRLASIIKAKSRCCWVSDSKTASFCSTPSSKIWKASRGRSGAGRLCSSRTLASTLTNWTLTRILPRCCWAGGSEGLSSGLTGDGGVEEVGDEAGAGVVVVLDALELALELALDLRAQGGRSDCAWVLAAPGTIAAKHRRKANRAGGIVERIELLRCRFRD